VVVGRGCLGRPWLFADLAAAFAGRAERRRPDLGEVAGVMRRHAELLAEWQGEDPGVRDFRKHVAWYLKGFSVGSEVRRALAMVSGLDELAGLLGGVATLGQLDDLLGKLDRGQAFPDDVLGRPRGRTSARRAVALPDGWLAARHGDAISPDAELPDSGG
jgi:hypothetical protein